MSADIALYADAYHELTKLFPTASWCLSFDAWGPTRGLRFTWRLFVAPSGSAAVSWSDDDEDLAALMTRARAHHELEAAAARRAAATADTDRPTPPSAAQRTAQ